MTSKFMRESIAELFAILYMGLVGFMFMIAGNLVNEQYISTFGYGLLICPSCFMTIRFCIDKAYRRYDPDPLEGRR